MVIEDEVEIGSNSTIDRATIGATILHRGVKLDDQVHIGHNCEIGEYSRFAALVGIAGSVKIGKWCQFGGNSGCADHVTIGDRVMVAAKSGIHADVASDSVVGGVSGRRCAPVASLLRWRCRDLPELIRRMRALEDRIERLLKSSS